MVGDPWCPFPNKVSLAHSQWANHFVQALTYYIPTQRKEPYYEKTLLAHLTHTNYDISWCLVSNAHPPLLASSLLHTTDHWTTCCAVISEASIRWGKLTVLACTKECPLRHTKSHRRMSMLRDTIATWPLTIIGDAADCTWSRRKWTEGVRGKHGLTSKDEVIFTSQ